MLCTEEKLGKVEQFAKKCWRGVLWLERRQSTKKTQTVQSQWGGISRASGGNVQNCETETIGSNYPAPALNQRSFRSLGQSNRKLLKHPGDK